MYEVYALKYSERDTTKCQFFYREASHEKLTLHYFVWLILGGPQPVLVDTGFLDDEATSRGMRNYVSPASGVRPTELACRAHDAEPRQPRPVPRRRPRGVPRAACAQGRRPHRGAAAGQRRDQARHGCPHLGCLAF